MSEYQPAAYYLPHASPMVLVEQVLMVSDEEAHCRVRVSADSVLAPFLNPQGHYLPGSALKLLPRR
ncbi:hypothetical protein ERHA55_17380 [Erwinia rhapontici]|nr:hypothetical protein ERHA55_17380 [Erwinia rhapontici]